MDARCLQLASLTRLQQLTFKGLAYYTDLPLKPLKHTLTSLRIIDCDWAPKRLSCLTALRCLTIASLYQHEDVHPFQRDVWEALKAAMPRLRQLVGI